jgi:rhodanese-related sulfurtransferase
MVPITVAELDQWLGDTSRVPPLVLDVREPWEVNLAAFPDALHVPMNQVPASLQQIDDGRAVVCVCHHGARSMQVALFLESQGVAQVYNLTGGIDMWSVAIDSGIKRY